MITSKLANLIKSKGWTLYRLRKESGVSYPTLLGLRDSTTNMFRADVLDKLCRALHCELGDLLVYRSGRKTKRRKSKQN